MTTPAPGRTAADVLVARPMDGMVVRALGDSVPLRIAATRLRALGCVIETGDAPPPGAPAGWLGVTRAPDPDWPLNGTLPECRIGWSGPVAMPLTGERDVQAACGIMQVHGRATGAPRPLGVDYASVCAGVLAAQAITAGTLGLLRGGTAVAAATSVAQAALLALTQYIAVATTEPGPGRPVPAGARVPPFRSADGIRFEIETFDAENWLSFWTALGVEHAAIAAGWPPFQQRFATATCTLPPALGATTLTRDYRNLRATAEATGVSILPIRAASTPGLPVRRSPPPDDSASGARCSPPPDDSASGARCSPPPDDSASVARCLPPPDDSTSGAPPSPWRLRALPGSAGPAPGLPPLGPHQRQPLAGLRVLESTNRVQGPLAGHLLGLLGAEVVRLEPPGGDPLRGVPPMAGDCSARFLALNRGKGAVEADLKTPPGRSTALRLAASAHVFLHNWPPGRAARFGLDHHDLAAVQPSLIYAHAGGWADALPAPQPLGTDYLVQAYTGVASLLTPPGEPPTPTLMTITDVLGAFISAEGIVAALLARARTGTGVCCETGLVDAGRLICDAPTGGSGSAVTAVTDLAAMSADPAFSAALDTDGAATYSRAPWTFSVPASNHSWEATP